MVFIIFSKYISWHFTVAPQEIILLMRNFLLGTWHHFGITQHARTILYPWRKQIFDQEPGSDILANIGNKIISKIADIYLRLFAAVIRLSIIVTGLVIESVIFISFIVLLVLWILWPLVLITTISQGINYLL